jgi:hypothetical protein
MNTSNELTDEQIARQDLVDNAINNLLTEVTGLDIESWNAYDRGQIRDVLEKLIVRDYSIMTTEDFYPFFEEED